MKTFVLTAIPLLLAATASAQPPEDRRRGDMVERMMSFDSDKDGKLAKDEIPERLQSLFARADSDEDGVLTRDEVAADLRDREGDQGAEQRRGGDGRGREGGGRGRDRGGFGGQRGEGGFRGRGGMPPNPVFSALDANHDGEISAEEIDNATAALKKLDRNGDGRLEMSELRPERGRGFGPRPGGEGRPPRDGDFDGQRGPGEMVSFMLERFDKDGDGRLTGDEIPERMRGNLAQIDTNGDKAVDKSELEAMARRFGGHGRGPGRPPGEREGGERRRPPMEE